MTRMPITVYFCDQNRVCYFKIVTTNFVHSPFILFYFILACIVLRYLMDGLYNIKSYLCTVITKWIISMGLESGDGQNQVYPITLKLQKVIKSLALTESCHV